MGCRNKRNTNFYKILKNMNWKIIGYVAAILLILVLLGGIGFTFMRTTETYKAKEQHYYTTDVKYYPLSGGCAMVRVLQEGDQKTKEPVKK